VDKQQVLIFEHLRCIQIYKLLFFFLSLEYLKYIF
jgi:hypothetical protein